MADTLGSYFRPGRRRLLGVGVIGGITIIDQLLLFHSKYTEGCSIVKYRSNTNLEIICKTLSYGPF